MCSWFRRRSGIPSGRPIDGGTHPRHPGTGVDGCGRLRRREGRVRAEPGLLLLVLVGGRRHTVGMTRAGVADVAGMVDRLAESVVAGADELLRSGAGLPLPTVHMLCADLEGPYVGHLTCRVSAAGRDTASAVGLLGRLPAIVAATHLDD